MKNTKVERGYLLNKLLLCKLPQVRMNFAIPPAEPDGAHLLSLELCADWQMEQFAVKKKKEMQLQERLELDLTKGGGFKFVCMFKVL